MWWLFERNTDRVRKLLLGGMVNFRKRPSILSSFWLIFILLVLFLPQELLR